LPWIKERRIDSQTIEAAAAGWILRREADDWSDAKESPLIGRSKALDTGNVCAVSLEIR